MEISRFEDPNASGCTVYVTDGDIPQNLVAALNRISESGISITSRDVSKFLNDALKRYYSTELWPVAPEVAQKKNEAVKTEISELSDKDGKKTLTKDIDKKCCFICEMVKYELSKNDLVGERMSKCTSTGGSHQIESCGICGKKLTKMDGKYASRAMNQNVVLLMSLSLAGHMHSKCARILTAFFEKRPPKICHIHMIQA
ncbi:hypothetical protein OSTOST_16501, partial [Ostertagia ostertagi]